MYSVITNSVTLPAIVFLELASVGTKVCEKESFEHFFKMHSSVKSVSIYSVFKNLSNGCNLKS